MTGKTDMVPVLNLPSHLSQPSQSENVPIFGRGTRCYFAPEKSRFWSKPREGKGKFTATPRLAPVARGVAACGPLCGLAGRRWGTDTTRPIWARVGELFGAPKAEELHSEILYIGFWTDKGNADSATLELLSKLRDKKVFLFGTAFHQRRRRREFSAGGGVENRNDPAVTGKAAGSRQKFKEESRDDK